MTTKIKTEDWKCRIRKDRQNEWRNGCNIYTLGEIAIEDNKVWRTEKREWLNRGLEKKFVLVKYRLIWSDEKDKEGEPENVYVEIEEMREYKSRNALMNALRKKGK